MSGLITGGAQMALGRMGGDAQEQDLYATSGAELKNQQLKLQESQELGAFQATKLRLAGSQMIARQQTSYAKAGIETTTGTPLSVMADTRLMSELDAKTAQNNAARAAFGYAENEKTIQASYAAKRKQIEAGVAGSFLSAGASMGSSASSLGGMFGG